MRGRGVRSSLSNVSGGLMDVMGFRVFFSQLTFLLEFFHRWRKPVLEAYVLR